MSRHFIALVALAPALLLVPTIRDAASDTTTKMLDRFDKRPTRRILVIGNSRTYYHDMPAMVRRMADSAHATQRLEIVTRALSGGSLEDSWNDEQTQRLLTQAWDDVVIQGESRAQSDESQRAFFHAYGRQFAATLEAGGLVPSFIVNWAYGEKLFEGYEPGARWAQYEDIQRDYRRLAVETHANLINIGAVWERVHSAELELALYEDGNHPSLAGSYLSALVLYARLTHGDPAAVTYVPWGLGAADAAAIRRDVAAALATGTS